VPWLRERRGSPPLEALAARQPYSRSEKKLPACLGLLLHLVMRVFSRLRRLRWLPPPSLSLSPSLPEPPLPPRPPPGCWAAAAAAAAGAAHDAPAPLLPAAGWPPSAAASQAPSFSVSGSSLLAAAAAGAADTVGPPRLTGQRHAREPRHAAERNRRLWAVPATLACPLRPRRPLAHPSLLLPSSTALPATLRPPPPAPPTHSPLAAAIIHQHAHVPQLQVSSMPQGGQQAPARGRRGG